MANRLYWEMKEKSKDELIKILESNMQQLANWSELAMTMASYYYNIEPHATIFKDKTFNQETLQMVKSRAKKNLRSCIYKRVTFITRKPEEHLDKLPVDILELSEDGYEAFINLIEEFITIHELKEIGSISIKKGEMDNE
jgi:hypothetical protein